jgi:hypothetical protein
MRDLYEKFCWAPQAALLIRLAVIATLLAVAPVTAETPVLPLRDVTRSAMIEGLDALKQQDYRGAQKQFLVAKAMLDQRPVDADSYEDRATRAAVAYLTAKVAGEGKLGNPCPTLTLAQSYVDGAAVLAAKRPDVDHMGEVGSEAGADIAAANIKFGCVTAPSPEKGSIPDKFAGHYYLSGVMETGSELLLRPNGAYEYFISYGAVDEFSQGTWQRVGDEIVLSHTKTPTGGALFKLDALVPWDVDAEDIVQSARHDAQVKVVEALCPFLGEPDVNDTAFSPPMVTAPTMPPTIGNDPPKVDYALVYQRAKAAEVTIRRTYERAAQWAMKPENINAQRHETARGARYEWATAQNALLSARHRADGDDPVPPSPILPSACKLPEATAASDIAEQDWVRGFGVIVGDPVAGAKFSNVTIRFHFADGQTTDAKTQRRGFAWVEKRPGNPVSAISLSYQRGMDRENAPFERFEIPKAIDGVQRIVIDSRQLIDPPFDEMRLTIRDGDLTGPRGRGLYSKRN